MVEEETGDDLIGGEDGPTEAELDAAVLRAVARAADADPSDHSVRVLGATLASLQGFAMAMGDWDDLDLDDDGGSRDDGCDGDGTDSRGLGDTVPPSAG